MNKYVIELRPDCKVVQEICESDGQVSIGAKSINYLEELTADYINEHYGSLQDEAYKRGINDGSLDVKQRVEGAYQRGLNDAWDAARKLFSSMADSDIEKAFPIEWNNGGFNALINLQPQEAIAKLKAYEEKQKADDEIKVGDEVKHKSDRVAWTAIVTRISCGTLTLMGHSGASADNYPIEDFVKTGRHFDIASILEAMKA